MGHHGLEHRETISAAFCSFDSMFEAAGFAESSQGSIGKDKFGEEMKKACAKDGVNVQYFECDEKATGTCAVAVKDGERSLCANLSAAEMYKIDDLNKPEKWAVVEQAKFYYMVCTNTRHSNLPI